jgi:hypothetical protein
VPGRGIEGFILDELQKVSAWPDAAQAICPARRATPDRALPLTMENSQ